MRLASLAAFLVACQSPAAPPRASLGSSGGRAAPCEGRACEERCTAGDAEACARAAELFFDGKSGHPLDMARSFRYASRACDAGVMFGCFLVGYHYQDGLGTAWDPARAVAAYERACAGGAGTACYNLGTMYSGGQGIDPDPPRGQAYKDRALAAWKAACDGSEPRWCTNAAYLVVGQSPSPADLRAGLALHDRACRAGVLIGCIGVARMKQALGELDGPAMVAELERICERGEPEACTVAGLTVSIGSDVDADPRRGDALFRRGCDGGDESACYMVGLGRSSEDFLPEAPGEHQALIRACDRADGRACASLAERTRRRGDLASAIPMERRACHMGQPESCLLVAVATLAGRGGTTRSEADGVAWAREACRGGVADGCRLLLERGVALPLPADLAAHMRARLCQDGMPAACAAPAQTPPTHPTP